MRHHDIDDTKSIYLHSSMALSLSLEITVNKRIYQLASNGQRIEPSLDSITLLNILNQFTWTDPNGWQCNQSQGMQPVTEGISFTLNDLSFTLSFNAQPHQTQQVADICDDIIPAQPLQDILPTPQHKSAEEATETNDDDILKKLEQEYYDLMFKRQRVAQPQVVTPLLLNANASDTDPFVLAQNLKTQNIQDLVEGRLSISDVEKHLPDTIPDDLFQAPPVENVLSFFMNENELPKAQPVLSDIVIREHLRPTLGSRMSLIRPPKNQDNQTS